jgi:GntR family transcriptional regulator
MIMIVTVPDRPPKLPYLAVADALRERLDHGEWLPGEQLPSARELADTYGVNHSTAHRAVKLLESEGRLTTIRGWGTFVAERPGK